MKFLFILILLIPLTQNLYAEECDQSDQIGTNYCYGEKVLKDKSDRDHKFELLLSEFDKLTAEEGANLRNLAWDYFRKSALHEYIFDSYSAKNLEIMSIFNSLDEEFISFFISYDYQNFELDKVSDEDLNNRLEQIFNFMNENYEEMDWEDGVRRYVKNEFRYPIFEINIIDLHKKYLEYRDAYSNFYVKLNPSINIIKISNHLNKSRLDRLDRILSEMKSGKSIN